MQELFFMQKLLQGRRQLQCLQKEMIKVKLLFASLGGMGLTAGVTAVSAGMTPIVIPEVLSA
ncbi:hypothetical protein [Coraliomargarita parva]|uniref:hypothetical protein n=1 Tax=Coraliomargarita parva TaxID=3014050 RepID=UPI0022B2E620|nr:hypothetical protein [Coraliomargarita parva]